MSAKHTEPKTILFIDHTAALSGAEIALATLLEHLDRKRFTPVVLLGADGPLRSRLAQAGIETHVMALPESVGNARKDRLGGFGLFRLGAAAATGAYILRLAKFIRLRRCALVHTTSLKADVIGGFAARLAGVPVVFHVHDRIESDYLPKSLVQLFRLLCRIVPRAVIANSTATLKTLRLPAGVRTAVIAPGLDLARFVRRETAGPVRKVGTVGRISPWKGQHIFLQAAARIHRRFPHVLFEIVGAALFDETDYERRLHDMTADLGLQDDVRFLGFRDDLPEILAGLDILVHGSVIPEPFGQVVIEAMAAGKPVVATAAGGILDIVVDQETGLLVPLGNADAMATAIVTLLEDPERAARMGEAGRARVRDSFTIERTAALVHAFYDELLPATPVDKLSPAKGPRDRPPESASRPDPS